MFNLLNYVNGRTCQQVLVHKTKLGFTKKHKLGGSRGLMDRESDFKVTGLSFRSGGDCRWGE